MEDYHFSPPTSGPASSPASAGPATNELLEQARHRLQNSLVGYANRLRVADDLDRWSAGQRAR